MILNTSSASSASSAIAKQNHRRPLIIRGVRWFWRFSQFYGEYTVRSPKERQQWINQQRD
ncbi:MAG: hypothetical protein WA949_04595 [Phormidesmis sp.]